MSEMDYLELIKDKELEFSSLYKRMDEDRELYYMKPYTLVDEKGVKIPDVENMTLNDPRTYADYVISGLLGAVANRQIKVESNDKGLTGRRIARIEQFLSDMHDANDRWLRPQGYPAGLAGPLCGQISLRGHIGARCAIRMEKDELVPGILPFDMRYAVYEIGAGGLEWAAYKTRRSKAAIKKEFGIDITGKDATVWVFYDDESERPFVDDKPLKERKHKLGYVPVVLDKAAISAYMRDEGYMEHVGESIYGANRNLYKEKNKLATILSTLTIMSFLGGWQLDVDDPATAMRPKIPPYGKMKLLPVKAGTQGYRLLPVADIRQATRLLYAVVDGDLDRGGLPKVVFGNLTFPMPAVGIAQLGEAKDYVFGPRLQTLVRFHEDLAEMIIDQCIRGKINAELGKKGAKTKYSYTELKGDYSIKYKFPTVYPEQNYAKYTLAGSAGNLISERTKREDILEIEDPHTEEQQILSEMADRLVPELALYKMACAKVDEDPDPEYEAKLIANKIGITLQQLKSGKMPEVPEEKREPAKKLLPLTGMERRPVSKQGRTSAEEAAAMSTEEVAEESE
jgi:hypothetical protein